MEATDAETKREDTTLDRHENSPDQECTSLCTQPGQDRDSSWLSCLHTISSRLITTGSITQKWQRNRAFTWEDRTWIRKLKWVKSKLSAPTMKKAFLEWTQGWHQLESCPREGKLNWGGNQTGLWSCLWSVFLYYWLMWEGSATVGHTYHSEDRWHGGRIIRIMVVALTVNPEANQ